MNPIKSIYLSLLALLIVILTAVGTGCAVQTGDDNGSNPPDAGVGTPPDAAHHDECQVAGDCIPVDGCSFATCDHGTCRSDAACDANEVCDESQDACVPATTLPTTHGISCSTSPDGNTLYVALAGRLTDAVYGGTLGTPVKVSIASDAVEGSWNTTTLSTTYQFTLTSNEQSLGGVISGSITIPSSKAQRFTLLVWPSTGTALRLDLSKWTVGGDDGCRMIADGGGETSTSDGNVIGRAPLCPLACNDNDSATADSCQATINPATGNGCWHGTGGTTNPGNGTISCSESGPNTNVTVSSGILSHLFVDGLVPTSSWSVRFGYGATDQEPWVSDSMSYMLTMPNTVTDLGIVLYNPANSSNPYYLDLSEYDFSGSCHKTCTDTGCGIAHTPPTTTSTNGSLSCAELDSSTTNVTVSGGILAHLFDSVSSPSSIRFGYGLSDYKPWTGDTLYTLSMPSATAEFNLFVRDSNGVDHWFNVNQFDTSGTCSHGTNAFAHTAQTTTVGNGTITCSLNPSGTDLTLSISGGILAHLLGTAVTPNSTWKIEYATVANPGMPYTSGKDMKSWVNDTWPYTLTMGGPEQGIQPALTDMNGYRWLDLAEYNVSGSGCYVSNGKIYH